jgi:hypothetical protein
MTPLGNDLHDAILLDIRMMWEDAVCVLRFRHQHTYEARFSGVTDLHLQKVNPWGASPCVNEVRQSDGAWEIEMQSGDIIRIQAASALLREERAAEPITTADASRG